MATKRSKAKRMSAALKKWLASQTKGNPSKRKSVKLKNFTGTVTRLKGGAVKITGKAKKR